MRRLPPTSPASPRRRRVLLLAIPAALTLVIVGYIGNAWGREQVEDILAHDLAGVADLRVGTDPRDGTQAILERNRIACRHHDLTDPDISVHRIIVRQAAPFVLIGTIEVTTGRRTLGTSRIFLALPGMVRPWHCDSGLPTAAGRP